MLGLTMLLIPLGLATAPLPGLLIIIAPGVVLVVLLSVSGCGHQHRLAEARGTVAVDEDGLHERWGSIIFTKPPSQIIRAWRHGDVAYVRIARATVTLALDLTTVDDPGRRRLIEVLGSGRLAPEPEGTIVARWKASPRDHGRALERVRREGEAPVREGRTLQLGWAAVLVVLVIALLLAPKSSGLILTIAVFLAPVAVVCILELLWRRWRWAQLEPSTLTVTTQGLVEREYGGRTVVSVPWSAVRRFSVDDGEVQVGTDPLGAMIVPAGASDDDQRQALRSAIALHRPEALTDDG